jgi:hypothetical protein
VKTKLVTSIYYRNCTYMNLLVQDLCKNLTT